MLNIWDEDQGITALIQASLQNKQEAAVQLKEETAPAPTPERVTRGSWALEISRKTRGHCACIDVGINVGLKADLKVALLSEELPRGRQRPEIDFSSIDPENDVKEKRYGRWIHRCYYYPCTRSTGSWCWGTSHRESSTPHTHTQQYVPHTIHRHICYIQTSSNIYSIHIQKTHNNILILHKNTGMHTKYRYMHIHTKTHLPQYKIHIHHIWLHSLHINYKHHIDIQIHKNVDTQIYKYVPHIRMHTYTRR